MIGRLARGVVQFTDQLGVSRLVAFMGVLPKTPTAGGGFVHRAAGKPQSKDGQ